MTERYTSLTLNGNRHTKAQLLRTADAYNSEMAIAGWEKNLYDFISEWLSDSPIAKVQTSGSTGRPHTFQVEKKKMIESALRTGKYLHLKQNDKALLCLPLNFIAGKMMVVRAFVLGLDLIAVKPSSDPVSDLDAKVDFAALTPMQVHYAMQHADDESAINRIKKLIIGGGALSVSLTEKIRRLKTDVWHTYGMAETLTHIAMKKHTGGDASSHFSALPGVSFSCDERGCLVIYAPWLSEQAIVTNDLIELIDKTTFDFKGRFDNLINSGGIKLSPESLESSLSGRIKNRFIVAGLPDDVLGEKVVIIVEGAPDKEKEIRAILTSANLSSYQKPREIHFMYHFPETESGKILRRQITDHLQDS